MEKFKELEKLPASEVEQEIASYWDKIDILDRTISNREGRKNFVFYDGPATANGFPGLHHMVAKFLKDSFCKYKTMQGYRVLRKVGWDTHGLPVELEVEKTLGFHNKSEIEKYGIEEFNKKCREIVWKNEKAFTDLTKKMGQFIDLEHPYVTYDNNYIETEWWILKKFFDEGLFYEGHKILPFCTRCGTGLASHEVAQAYKEITVNSVIVPMKLKNKDEYFLVWTTTPWTLIANVALCVNPNEEYIKVLSKGYKFILASKLAPSILGEDYEVLEKYLGKDLEYTEYEQLLPFLIPSKKAFYVTCDNYVTMEDGTGIVHLAPAFGQDDANVGKKYDLPVLNPVGEDGKYLEGPWKGMYVFDADLEVIKYLKENDKLFKKIKMTHNYPHCWRCGTPLLYYSKPSYYLEITKIKDKIVAANKTVNWYPKYVGEKRFGNWLEDLNDWAISRNRYWGTPLPLWICECGHTEMIGSREELVSKAVENITCDIDLHRPYVDNVHLTCPECGKLMTRTKDVIDCWFDSGSMPFAQYHYPFENKELFESQFPADFIAEGIDQTRGWFYTLLVISTFVKGVSPYKNVLVNDLLLDAEGKKMSKSKGNIVEPFTTIKEYGADTVRFYLPYASPVWMPLKFDISGLKEVYSKFFNPLRNTYSFFVLYANTDNVDPRLFEVKYDELEEIDKWILSKFNKLIKNVTSYYEEYDLNKVVRLVTAFVSDDLSNWYIRRTRKRFWGSKLDTSKKAVYQTTYQILRDLSKLIAPICPFISEEIYRNLTNLESVHLADFPKYNEAYINEEIEEKMDLVIDLISLGRNVREEAKIKVRQPLSEVILDAKYEDIIGDLDNLIKEELNVKNIKYESNLEEYMNIEYKPNYKLVGKLFGKDIKDFASYLQNISYEDIEKLNNGSLTINLNNNEYHIDKEMVDFRISAKEGYNVDTYNNKFVVLNTHLTDELINEGLARETISKVQQLRKTLDFDVADRINIYYNSNDEYENRIKSFEDFIKDETLCINLIKDNSLNDYIDVNEYKVAFKLEKNNKKEL